MAWPTPWPTGSSPRLREFRDRLNLADTGADAAAQDRLMLVARLPAVAIDDPETHLSEPLESLKQPGLGHSGSAALLLRAWEAIVGNRR